VTRHLVIPKFDDAHANAELRKQPGKWHWVRVPVTMDSLRRKRLMQTPGGREAFAIYVHLVEIAAKNPPRGELADERGPLTLEDLTLITSIPADALMSGIETLASADIGWVKWSDQTADGAPDEAAQPIRDDRGDKSRPSGRSGRDRREQDSRPSGNGIPDPLGKPKPHSNSNSDSGSDSHSGKGGGGGKPRPALASSHWLAVSAKLPQHLRTDAVREAWLDWEQHRRERGPKLTPKAIEKQAKTLAEMNDEDRIVRAIEHSIAGSYQGIFEPGRKAGGAGKGSQTPTERRAERRRLEGAELVDVPIR